ncbi:Bug family tripartite tricarboxylate transporter substrate binding protein [Lampropedia aestuarii]|uniref:Bug family tripartite tricarboxylate transporter substrate binding protein n=1 Tax=Lampropedia aestuarii TaxID=2562762 RepID=UPI002469720E|nr:tripartite tricarboxylate transporter substrate-binding protein [Lampropedia aestuarii]MDH5858712.1 tripartite tricarboxylate transporter substrate-binding protein [Lampropedia aestuarii]
MAIRLITRRHALGLGVALSLLGMPLAFAQSADPVRLLVPFPPGGGTDVVARLLGSTLEPIIGAPVVVENRAGASGTIGIAAAAKLPANGRGLVLGQADNLAVAPLLIKGVAYDPQTSFKAVAHVADVPILIATAASQPYQNLNDVIAAGKQDPTLLTFASAGVGTTPHLSGELFAQAAGIDMQHVSYQGSAPALADVLAGRVTLMTTSISLAVPYIKAGKLRPLAVTSAARSSALPDVPTVAEAAGIEGFNIGTWYGIFAPAATPDAVVQTLNAQINQALADEKVVQFLEVQEGAQIRRSTPEELQQLLQGDIPRWQKVIETAKVEL